MLLRFMLAQARDDGYQVIIIDSKLTEPEFDGIGVDIPFYLQESTDPDVYKSLIEGMRTRGRGDMNRYRGGFIEVCEPFDEPPAKDYAEIGERLKAKLASKKIQGGTRAMYSEIYHDHLRLVKLLQNEGYPWGDVADHLGDGDVLRMPTRNLPNLNLQGLVVRSVIERLLPLRGKMVFLVDEAPNFVNQKLYNPAKSALQQLDSQGRSADKFGWYSGQTLTGFDKPNMKNLWYWILGREMERNEAQAVAETQTDKVLTVDAVKKLKVREFLASTPDWTKLITVPVVGADELVSVTTRVVDQGGRPIRNARVTVEPKPREEDWSDVAKRSEDLLEEVQRLMKDITESSGVNEN